MIENKKGLSDVVTTVLIILLVLVAVTIIAVYVLGAVQKGASQITGACLNVQIEPTNCSYYPPAGSTTCASGATTCGFDVFIKRGSSNVEITELKLILADSAGATTITPIALANVPGVLATTKSYTSTAILFNDKNKFKTAKVAAVIKTETGEIQTCGESKVVSCTQTA